MGLFSKKAPSNVQLQPSGLTFTVAPKHTILETALSEGIKFPHRCRVGGCGTCKCKVLEGTVQERLDSSYVLSANEIQDGYVLGCQSICKSDVVIEVALDD